MSGGGARGLAHIGVIKMLEENNIPIDYVAGTSMGAIIAALYSMGYTPEEMIAMMKTDDFNWSWNYFYNLLTNWQFMACGICYGAGSILWMYIIKNFPFSLAYPMISLSYIIGMFSAIC